MYVTLYKFAVVDITHLLINYMDLVSGVGSLVMRVIDTED